MRVADGVMDVRHPTTADEASKRGSRPDEARKNEDTHERAVETRRKRRRRAADVQLAGPRRASALASRFAVRRARIRASLSFSYVCLLPSFRFLRLVLRAERVRSDGHGRRTRPCDMRHAPYVETRVSSLHSCRRMKSFFSPSWKQQERVSSRFSREGGEGFESFFSALGARDGVGKVRRGRRGFGRTWARAWRNHPRRLDVVGRMGCICAVRTSCDRCVLHQPIPRRTVDECCLRGRMVVDPRRSHPIGRKSERMPTRNGRNGVQAGYGGTVESSTGIGSDP